MSRDLTLSATGLLYSLDEVLLGAFVECVEDKYVWISLPGENVRVLTLYPAWNAEFSQIGRIAWLTSNPFYHHSFVRIRFFPKLSEIFSEKAYVIAARIAADPIHGVLAANILRGYFLEATCDWNASLVTEALVRFLPTKNLEQLVSAYDFKDWNKSFGCPNAFWTLASLLDRHDFHFPRECLLRLSSIDQGRYLRDLLRRRFVK